MLVVTNTVSLGWRGMAVWNPAPRPPHSGVIRRDGIASLQQPIFWRDTACTGLLHRMMAWYGGMGYLYIRGFFFLSIRHTQGPG